MSLVIQSPNLYAERKVGHLQRSKHLHVNVTSVYEFKIILYETNPYMQDFSHINEIYSAM